VTGDETDALPAQHCQRIGEQDFDAGSNRVANSQGRRQCDDECRDHHTTIATNKRAGSTAPALDVSSIGQYAFFFVLGFLVVLVVTFVVVVPPTVTPVTRPVVSIAAVVDPTVVVVVAPTVEVVGDAGGVARAAVESYAALLLRLHAPSATKAATDAAAVIMRFITDSSVGVGGPLACNPYAQPA